MEALLMPWDRLPLRFDLAAAVGLALAATVAAPSIALAQSDHGTSVAVDPEVPPPPALEPGTDPG